MYVRFKFTKIQRLRLISLKKILTWLILSFFFFFWKYTSPGSLPPPTPDPVPDPPYVPPLRIVMSTIRRGENFRKEKDWIQKKTREYLYITYKTLNQTYVNYYKSMDKFININTKKKKMRPIANQTNGIVNTDYFISSRSKKMIPTENRFI